MKQILPPSSATPIPDGNSFLALANLAFRQANYPVAIANYVLAMALQPQMRRTIGFNLERALQSHERNTHTPCDIFMITSQHIGDLGLAPDECQYLHDAVGELRGGMMPFQRHQPKHFSPADLVHRRGPEHVRSSDTREVKVSVICITYNHEKYIRQALDGFVMQQTAFRFEVIIGDDCSTDRTQQVIAEYCALYPDLFVPVLRERNIGIARNLLDLMQMARGTYVAMNEGDDYWTDPCKLQLQAEHLDDHPECAVCFHPVKVINDDDPYSVSLFPTHLVGERFGLADLVEENFIQTNSVMYRWGGKKGIFDNYNLAAFPADLYIHTLHATLGEIHLLPRVMAVYRRNGGGVFSSITDHLALVMKWGEAHIELFRTLDAKLDGAYHSQYRSKEISIMRSLVREHLKKQDFKALVRLLQCYSNSAAAVFEELGLTIDPASVKSELQLREVLARQCRISVLVTAYNHAAHLEQCLEGIVAQAGFFALEIIVADDASTDGSRAFLERFAAQHSGLVSLLPVQSNMGMLKNMLRGFQACTGNYIAVCEGDDYWISPNKLHRQLCMLLFDNTLAMSFNWLLLQNERDGTLTPHPQQGALPRDRLTFDELLLDPVTANFSCCLYRKDAVHSVPQSYYEEVGAADWLFNLCVASQGDIGFLRETLSVYRIHASGQWSGLSTSAMRIARLRASERFTEYFGERAQPAETTLSLCPAGPLVRSLGCKLAVDTAELRYRALMIYGWMFQEDAISASGTDKWLLLTDAQHQIVKSQLMKNVMRQDVDEEFGATGRYCHSGFDSVLTDLPTTPDETYEIWIALSRVGKELVSAPIAQLRIDADGVPSYHSLL